MQQKIKSILVLSLLLLVALTNVATAEESKTNLMFVLGTDTNEASLTTMSSHPNITSNLTITIFNSTENVPAGFNFSNYSVIFLDSQSESVVNGWQSNISSNLTTAKENGTDMIGYNLSSNVTVSNIDLYSDEYTDIERYWIQGGDTNIESIIKFMGQKFCDHWTHETIA